MTKSYTISFTMYVLLVHFRTLMFSCICISKFNMYVGMPNSCPFTSFDDLNEGLQIEGRYNL